MADDERRMLFDIRGRRKNVIRVIYAGLALLMAASLFVAVGPFNIGELLGGSRAGEAAEIFTDQAERIEKRLVKNPNDADQLLALTRARINAGNSLVDEDPQTGGTVVTPEAEDQFELAEDAWQKYLEAADEPNPNAAQLVATNFFTRAENSETLGDIEDNITGAVEAQKIAAEARPTVGALTMLAIFQYYNLEFAAGDKTAKRAEAAAGSKAEAKRIEKQMAQYRKRTKAWAKQVEQLKKANKGKGKEALENPLGGLSGGTP